MGSSASTDPQHLDEQEIWVNVVQAFDIKVGLVTDALLIPGLEVLRSEHHFDLAYLSQLCWESPVVPPGHVELWARGLWHGLKGDLPSAVSLLVPRIEQFIRQALKARGVHTLVVDPQTGVEIEKGLGALLAMPEATAFLGENVHLELTALLVEPRGANLRNNVAHGLLRDSAAWSAPRPFTRGG